MNQINMRWASLIAPLASLLLLLTGASLAAADLPKAWINEALKDTDESVHLIIKNHMKSQLDWRSYYKDRKGTGRALTSENKFQSSTRFSQADSVPHATGDGPTCSETRAKSKRRNANYPQLQRVNNLRRALWATRTNILPAAPSVHRLPQEETRSPGFKGQ
jgi:hypothetical protein